MSSSIEYSKFMREYGRQHECCPDCGASGGHLTTLVAYVLDLSNKQAYKDLNRCECDCGSIHTVHDRVPKNNTGIPKKDPKHGLYKYPEEINNRTSKYFPMMKIVVDSELSKEQLLNAIEYIHNLECIDSDYMAVNSLMHLYLYPDSIEVKPDYDFNLGEQR